MASIRARQTHTPLDSSSLLTVYRYPSKASQYLISAINISIAFRVWLLGAGENERGSSCTRRDVDGAAAWRRKSAWNTGPQRAAASSVNLSRRAASVWGVSRTFRTGRPVDRAGRRTFVARALSRNRSIRHSEEYRMVPSIFAGPRGSASRTTVARRTSRDLFLSIKVFYLVRTGGVHRDYSWESSDRPPEVSSSRRGRARLPPPDLYRARRSVRK